MISLSLQLTPHEWRAARRDVQEMKQENNNRGRALLNQNSMISFDQHYCDFTFYLIVYMNTNE